MILKNKIIRFVSCRISRQTLLHFRTLRDLKNNSQTMNKHQSRFTKTSFQIYFSLLKWTGLFPYHLSLPRIKHSNQNEVNKTSLVNNNKMKDNEDNSAKIKQNEEIFTSASSKFQLIHHLIFTILCIYNLFMFFQFTRTVFLPQFVESSIDSPHIASTSRVHGLGGLPLPLTLSVVCWAFRVHSTFIIFVIFYWKKKAICSLCNNWYVAEMQILSRNESNPLAEFYGKNSKTRWFTVFCIMVLLATFLFGAAMNQWYYPRHVMYIYSLLPKNVELLWLRFISAGINLAMFMINLLHTSLFIFFIIIFSENIVDCLKISKFHHNGNDERIPSIESQLSNALANYNLLSSLVVEFNQIFASFLIYLKSNWLLNICILVYLPLNYLSKLPILGYFLFFPAATSIGLDAFNILIKMGAVYTESVLFKESWGKSLIHFDSTSGNYYKLNQCRTVLGFLLPIQFRFGHFYNVYPNTVLTFFSVVTTYLIVLLQIDAF